MCSHVRLLLREHFECHTTRYFQKSHPPRQAEGILGVLNHFSFDNTTFLRHLPSSLIISNGPFGRLLWTTNIAENQRLPSRSTLHTPVSGSTGSSLFFFLFARYDLWQLLWLIMHGVSARYMLRDDAANQSEAVQWPELTNHPKEPAEMTSGPPAGMTPSFIFTAFLSTMLYIYPHEHFAILEH